MLLGLDYKISCVAFCGNTGPFLLVTLVLRFDLLPTHSNGFL